MKDYQYIMMVTMFFALLLLYGMAKKNNIEMWGLFTEDDKRLSVGRLAFWIVLFIACFKWILDKEIGIYHNAVLGFLIAYNLGKKAFAILKLKTEKTTK
jgi:uncharacterized BrkB/YihY/UPF0761 family membrane protein